MRVVVALVIAAALHATMVGGSAAQPAGSEAEQTATGESTVLVPPQGGTARIAVHPTTNVLLSFPEPLASRAVASTKDWEIREFGDGVVARATSPKAADTTLALATRSNSIRVNVTLTVATSTADALTLVRFKASTAEEAFRAAVQAEVERQTASMRAEIAEIKRAIATKIRDRADNMVARRLLTRHETQPLNAHDRNGDHVIVHVEEVVFLGEDAYLVFEIENRSSSAYRLAKVQVHAPGGKDHAGPASALSTVADDDLSVIGVVAAGAKSRVAVVLRQVDDLLARPLTLTIAEPAGRGRITVRRGIVLR